MLDTLMILPEGDDFLISFNASWDIFIGPSMLTRLIFCQFSGEYCFSKEPSGKLIPALFTKISNRPNFELILSTMAFAAAGSDVSPAAAKTPSSFMFNDDAMSPAACCVFSSSRPLITTVLHPACNKVSAIARPNPPVEPVTSATFPSYPKKDDKKESLSDDGDGDEEEEDVVIAVGVAIADVFWNRCCGRTTLLMFLMLMFLLLTLL
mmetsp:Transcript_38529/g.93363  ORF Transcript_38529/g.93363 Transcript_38529/m.93363 type:complete len:208 (-) Transcript_38529:98-721(-)